MPLTHWEHHFMSLLYTEAFCNFILYFLHCVLLEILMLGKNDVHISCQLYKFMSEELCAYP